MTSFVTPSFGVVIDRLLMPHRLNDLGPGKPNTAARATLNALSAENLFAHEIIDRDMALACLAGLWLYHDFLDDSHSISQQIETLEGSYWHGIMHRREPDYANSKYWFRRVGDHAVGRELAVAASELAQQSDLDDASRYLASQTAWDHFRFVDLCEAAATGRSKTSLLCRQIQEREWWLLFGYCYERACSAN